MQSQNENILTILKKERDGIQAIRHIKDLLVYIQKLRGNSNLFGILYINSEENQIELYKSNITKLIGYLNRSFAVLDDLLGTNESLIGIDRELKKLEANLSKFHINVFDITVKHFDEYSKHARSTINLMIDVADRSYLLAESDKHQAILLNLLINIVLNLIENVGKLRAIGVKVINKKVKNIHDISELQYYVEIVRNYTHSFNKEFDIYANIIDNKKEREKFLNLKNRLSKDINYFIKLTEEELLNQEIIFIEPKYFFEQGDDIIKSENIFYNEIFKVLDDYINSRIIAISKLILRDSLIKYTSIFSITAFIIYTAESLFQ